MLPDPFGPEEFAAVSNVSRETLSRLKAYVGILQDWNARQNLVSARSLEDVWRRHIWDSAQLLPLIPPSAKTLADLGSGAGFPGLVLAELLHGRVRVSLFEATAKKCKFLEEVANRLNLDVGVCNQRIEDAAPEPFDVVTARAIAPLTITLGYAQQFMGPTSVCLLLKGQSVGEELTEARKSWNMDVLHTPSLTDPSGVVLQIRELSHVPVPPTPAKGSGRRQSKRRRR